MIYICLNAVAVIVGSLIGAIAKKGIREKYITVMNTAMGLAALVLGANVAMENMRSSNYPVLFIVCLSIGGLIGTALRFDQRMERATSRAGKNSDISQGLTTAILFCCVGTLSMMGPVLSALKGDNTYLLTAATLNLVTMCHRLVLRYMDGARCRLRIHLAERIFLYRKDIRNFHLR